MEMDGMSSLTSFTYFPFEVWGYAKRNRPEKRTHEWRPSNRDMMVRLEPKEWLPAAHKWPRNDSKPRVCKLPTKPLFPFKSLIRCWESITPGPVWRVSLVWLCMVWKPVCLLRFGEVGVKTPTLFVLVCVCVCVSMLFLSAKLDKMGTRDIDSC